MFFVFCFFSFAQLGVPIVIRCVFRAVSFFKLYFVSCIISLIFFLVYIIFLSRQSSPIVSAIFTSKLFYCTIPISILIWVIVILVVVATPLLGILVLHIIMYILYFFLYRNLFHSLVSFTTKIFLVLQKLYRKFFYLILKPWKNSSHRLSESDNKFICWFIKLCKRFICWLQI